MRPVLIFDALNVFMRHYAANPTMSDNGSHSGGTVGFMKNIRLLCEKINPEAVIVVWEGGGSLRRRALFKEYKAGRKPPKMNRYYEDDIPDSTQNRNYQISLLVKLLSFVPIKQIYVGDCEADDVIGYLVKNRLTDRSVIIVSSDKDYYQLLSTGVTQWSPGQKKMITPDIVRDKFGISVTNFCTARSIIGDKSDNIDGVRGAGFKTLAKRFPELEHKDFTSVNDIIRLAKMRGEDSKIKIFERICSASEVIRRNWRLMHLDTMNLSATHIEKISNIFNTSSLKRNKIGLMRLLIQEGLTSFDADSFFMALTASLEVR